MKEFIKKYLNEILIALGAISSIIASIMTMDGINAAVCSILIAILACLIEALKNGVSDKLISLIANAVMIIIEELKKSDNSEVSSATANVPLTVDSVKEMLCKDI